MSDLFGNQVVGFSTRWLNYISLRGAGAFSRNFTTNLTPQCRAFSRALKIQKLKAPLLPGPKGTGDTNDWCII